MLVFAADFYFRKKLIKAKRSFCHFEKWQKRINQRFLKINFFSAPFPKTVINPSLSMAL